MNGVESFDYADMVEQTPVTTWVIEYREPSVAGVPGALVGACLTDQQSDGLSMIYSFYDPELASRKGLGTFIILDHVLRARAARLPYVYLGYWIDGCDRMRYKVRFQPAERLTAARSEEHTSELQSLMRISYAVFCLKKKKKNV